MQAKDYLKLTMLFVLVTVPIAMVAACSSNNNDGGNNVDLLDIAVCAPDAGPFSLTIDNEWFPLNVGDEKVLEGEEDEEKALIRVEISVLDEIEEVAGVTTRVVKSTEYEDGELVEISWNFFVQAPDGTVCYFGEDVDIYEDGEVVSHDGAWRAGEGENLPGIIMPGDPEVGMRFAQESAPGIAEDMSQIMAFGETVEVPAGAFEDTMRTKDWNPLVEDDEDTKYYARGVGLIVDVDAELLSGEPGFCFIGAMM